MVTIPEENYVKHYGILRRSGRYPWGSGGNAHQRSTKFLAEMDRLRKEEGMSEAQIAKAFSTETETLTTTDIRAMKSIAKNEKRAGDIAQAQALKEKGYSNVRIGERMGLNESSVRGLLAPGAADKASALQTTGKILEDEVNAKSYIDVGSGVEQFLGVSRTHLNTAIASLKEKGYHVLYPKVEQLGTGEKTTMKILTKDDVGYGEMYQNIDNIKQIAFKSEDRGRTFLGIKTPESISSDRVQVNYAEDGGREADGTIYVRPGVDDVALGKSTYGQVRIAVDGSHYLKGMAIYKDDLPDGVDLVFNTNKSKKDVASDLDAMKPMKTDKDGNIDWDNPFGSEIKPGAQYGVMNMVNEEGDWQEWSKNLSSQMLSKQKPALAKQQLELDYTRRREELAELESLTNPAVKKKLLDTYADNADSAAVQLKAAALPGQATHVILPVNSMKSNEIYAPNYKNGESVVLIRYPHGGIFEIPELKVNNKQPEAKRLLGNAPDAIGINSKVAERLSGADFDGDTVLVIPNRDGKVKTAPALQGLKNFDPQRAYPGYEGMPRMSEQYKQNQMGDVSNLITDMTIKGASPSELARAVRHSMVVIDAAKHGLNYKLSAERNGIRQLKEKYQDAEGGRSKGGASTLISRKKQTIVVPERKATPKVDPKTGKLIWEETGRTYINKDGVETKRRSRAKRLLEVDDANELSSGTTVEKVYADYSNSMRDLANRARRESVNTKTTPYSPSAKAAYQKEVDTLNAKLNVALRNRPRERQAQVVANTILDMKKQANPDMTPDEVKKVRGQALTEARARTGAKSIRVDITPNEWSAIQAGAISNHKLTQILNRADLDRVKELATPRKATKMTPLAVRRAKAMANSGYTQAEIASALGVAPSTVSITLSE